MKTMSPAQLLLAGTLAILLGGCATKHIAYHSSERGLTAERRAQSVPLFLPRTVLEFQATCELEVVKASPLYLEATSTNATRRFGTNELFAAAGKIEVDVATNGSKTLKLKDASLGVRGERDPEQLFYVYLDDDWLTAVDFEAEYTPDGVVGSVSSSRQNQALDFSLKLLESAAATAGAFVKMMLVAPPDHAQRNLAVTNDVPGKLAARIDEIRAQRKALLSKPAERAGLDGAALGRILDELGKEEALVLQQFAGSTKSSATPIRVIVRPERNRPEPEKDLLAFRPDGLAPAEGKTNGVTRGALPSDFLSGGGTNTGRLVLRFHDREPGETRALAKLEEDAQGCREKGLPYQVAARVPASVELENWENGKTNRTVLATTDLLIGQWGAIARLPVSMGAPGSALKPVYYTESGALKKLTISSKPPSADSTKSLGTAAGSITDALKAREEANSEIGQLKKEKERLELEVAIQKARNELKGTNTVSAAGTAAP